MPEVVISNTSPIFYLHRLRRLDLGHILAVKSFIDRLQEIHFHLSDNVRTLILSIAEE